jgi:hypothetical protein
VVIARSWLDYHVQQIRTPDARCKNIIERSQEISMVSPEPQQFQRAKLTPVSCKLHLREEVMIFEYCLEALIHSQVPIDLPPLAVMPHIG